MNVSRKLKRGVVAAIAFNAMMLLVTVALSSEATIKHPMAGQLIDIDGLNIHVVSHPTPTSASPATDQFDAVVLLHGAGTSWLDFSTNLFPALAKQYPVVAIDRPGHGYSERGHSPAIYSPEQQAAVVLDTLSKLGVKKPVLLGHSWAGSLVLASLLIDHSEAQPVAGITLSGVSHPRDYKPSWLSRLVLNPTAGTLFRWLYLAPVGRFMVKPTVEKIFAPDNVPEDYIDNTGLILSVRPQTFLFNEQDRANLDEYLSVAANHYGRISKPVLSIAATEDRQVPIQAHHEKLTRQLTNVHSVVLDEAGHLPHHTHSGQVEEEIYRFLKSL